MSTCCHLVVLFKNAPSSERIADIEGLISNRTGIPIAVDGERYEKLSVINDADLIYDLHEDNSLERLRNERYSVPIGEYSPMQGRLLGIDYLSRNWSASYPEGPAMHYAITMLVLLNQSDVGGVWFGDDYWRDGGTCQSMTLASVHQLIDQFVVIGETFSGKPVKYIRTDDGVINSI